MTASLGLIAALIVLVVCILVTAVGFFTMYRRQTGLFRESRRNRLVRELNKSDETSALKSNNPILASYDRVASSSDRK
jgi:cell division protein FtsL